MRSKTRIATLSPLMCAALFLLVACNRSPNYHGDGTLTDFGIEAADERYVLDLGLVDLSRLNRRSFKLAGLPAVEFAMGLRQVNVSAGCAAAALNSTNVRMHVQAEDGQVVIDEEGPLSAWVTSSSLVYRRGKERREPKDGDAFRLVETGVRAFGGWGTYFTPQTSVTYLAKFEVVETRDTSGCESRLVLVGGGWK